MLISDFEQYGIVNFTPREVQGTGATVSSVTLDLMVKLQAFRTHPDVDRVVVLLRDGLTTGNHESYQHKNGTAVDVAFQDYEKPLVPKRLVYAALDVGFRGVGVYYNGTALSLHLDTGPRLRSWLWVKPHRADAWTKLDLILDPIELQRKEAVKWPEI